MTVECPSCGQRVELVGRVVPCPNCGQMITAVYTPPLAPRPGPAPLISETPEAMQSTPRPSAYRSRPAAEAQPAWLPATMIVLGAFLGIFVLLYFVTLKISSYATPTPGTAPPPKVAPPPAPAPAASDDERGSSLFSFSNETSAPSPPAVAPAPPPASAPPANALPPATAPTTTTVAAATRPIFKIVPATAPAEEIVTDEAITKAITRGVNHLLGKFDKNKLKFKNGDQGPGTHALAVLALLHAGQAINDDRLNIHSPLMIGLIEELKRIEIPEAYPTYTRSLRAQALAIYNRQEDRSTLASDTRWLIGAAVQGAYFYRQPPKEATQPSQFTWDNSNSQYGALGVWAAADAGIAIPPSYWEGVQQHWEQTQDKSGGWGYQTRQEPSLAMTAAGVNMLFVANEQLSALRPDVQIARPPFSPSLQLGLDWLGGGDHAIVMTGGYPYYTLYGLERAGLACGFKQFGPHDWFRALAAQVLKQQHEDGGWHANQTEIDTSFALLFLARGRHPLLMNKLHFVGAWANRPRDVAHIAKFTSKETERPLNWQVVSLSTDWGDWMDCPILYLASHEPPVFDDTDYQKLKSFVMAGGLLLTHADGGKPEFNQWAELLAQKLFERELVDLPPDHFIFNALFRPQEKFPLRGVSNGTRTLMIHCPTDIAKRWQSKSGSTDRGMFELAANLFVYATGMQVPRNRLDSVYVADLSGKTESIIPIARLKHAGDWNPEPYAWERKRRLFRRETSIDLAPTTVELEKLSIDVAPLAHLTGTAAITLADPQVKAIQSFVDGGGVLLIDPCGGSPAFTQSIRAGLLAKAFAGKEPTPIRNDHPVLVGKGDGLTQIIKPQVRPYVFKVLGAKFPKLQMIESGKGVVLFSEMDLTSGLLGTNTLGIVGYDPAYAHAFVRNAILWTINGRGGPPVWKTQEKTVTSQP